LKQHSCKSVLANLFYFASLKFIKYKSVDLNAIQDNSSTVGYIQRNSATSKVYSAQFSNFETLFSAIQQLWIFIQRFLKFIQCNSAVLKLCSAQFSSYEPLFSTIQRLLKFIQHNSAALKLYSALFSCFI